MELSRQQALAPVSSAIHLAPPKLCVAEVGDDVDEEEEEVMTSGIRPKSSPLPKRRSSECLDDYVPQPPPFGVRRVAFADAFGLSLVTVRAFSEWDMPYPLESFLARNIAAAGEFCLSCLFANPLPSEELQRRVLDQKLELESLTLLPGTTTLRGVVRVLNICYSKTVYARVSLDEWKSHFDLLAEHIPCSTEETTDCFSFKHTLVPQASGDGGVRVDLCLRYETDQGTFWASNGGRNYVVYCNRVTSTRNDTCIMENKQIKKSCLKPMSKCKFANLATDASPGVSTTEDECSIKQPVESTTAQNRNEQREKLLEEKKRNARRRKQRRAAKLAMLQDQFSKTEGETPNDQDVSQQPLPGEKPLCQNESLNKEVTIASEDDMLSPLKPSQALGDGLKKVTETDSCCGSVTSRSWPDTIHTASSAYSFGQTSNMDSISNYMKSVVDNSSFGKTKLQENYLEGARDKTVKSESGNEQQDKTEREETKNCNYGSNNSSFENPVTDDPNPQLFTFGTVVAPLYHEVFARMEMKSMTPERELKECSINLTTNKTRGKSQSDTETQRQCPAVMGMVSNIPDETSCPSPVDEKKKSNDVTHLVLSQRVLEPGEEHISPENKLMLPLPQETGKAENNKCTKLGNQQLCSQANATTAVTDKGQLTSAISAGWIPSTSQGCVDLEANPEMSLQECFTSKWNSNSTGVTSDMTACAEVTGKDHDTTEDLPSLPENFITNSGMLEKFETKTKMEASNEPLQFSPDEPCPNKVTENIAKSQCTPTHKHTYDVDALNQQEKNYQQVGKPLDVVEYNGQDCEESKHVDPEVKRLTSESKNYHSDKQVDESDCMLEGTCCSSNRLTASVSYRENLVTIETKAKDHLDKYKIVSAQSKEGAGETMLDEKEVEKTEDKVQMETELPISAFAVSCLHSEQDIEPLGIVGHTDASQPEPVNSIPNRQESSFTPPCLAQVSNTGTHPTPNTYSISTDHKIASFKSRDEERDKRGPYIIIPEPDLVKHTEQKLLASCERETVISAIPEKCQLLVQDKGWIERTTGKKKMDTMEEQGTEESQLGTSKEKVDIVCQNAQYSEIQPNVSEEMDDSEDVFQETQVSFSSSCLCAPSQESPMSNVTQEISKSSESQETAVPNETQEIPEYCETQDVSVLSATPKTPASGEIQDKFGSSETQVTHVPCDTLPTSAYGETPKSSLSSETLETTGDTMETFTSSLTQVKDNSKLCVTVEKPSTQMTPVEAPKELLLLQSTAKRKESELLTNKIRCEVQISLQESSQSFTNHDTMVSTSDQSAFFNHSVSDKVSEPILPLHKEIVKMDYDCALLRSQSTDQSEEPIIKDNDLLDDDTAQQPEHEQTFHQETPAILSRENTSVISKQPSTSILSEYQFNKEKDVIRGETDRPDVESMGNMSERAGVTDSISEQPITVKTAAGGNAEILGNSLYSNLTETSPIVIENETLLRNADHVDKKAQIRIQKENQESHEVAVRGNVCDEEEQNETEAKVLVPGSTDADVQYSTSSVTASSSFDSTENTSKETEIGTLFASGSTGEQQSDLRHSMLVTDSIIGAKTYKDKPEHKENVMDTVKENYKTQTMINWSIAKQDGRDYAYHSDGSVWLAKDVREISQTVTVETLCQQDWDMTPQPPQSTDGKRDMNESDEGDKSTGRSSKTSLLELAAVRHLTEDLEGYITDGSDDGEIPQVIENKEQCNDSAEAKCECEDGQSGMKRSSLPTTDTGRCEGEETVQEMENREEGDNQPSELKDDSKPNERDRCEQAFQKSESGEETSIALALEKKPSSLQEVSDCEMEESQALECIGEWDDQLSRMRASSLLVEGGVASVGRQGDQELEGKHALSRIQDSLQSTDDTRSESAENSAESLSDDEMELYMCALRASRKTEAKDSVLRGKREAATAVFKRLSCSTLSGSLPCITESLDEDERLAPAQTQDTPTVEAPARSKDPLPTLDMSSEEGTWVEWGENCFEKFSKALVCILLLVTFAVTAYFYDFMAYFMLYMFTAYWLFCQKDNPEVK